MTQPKIPPKPPEKKYYDVKVESMLPATLVYKVLAESPEQASLSIKNMQPIGVKYKLIGRKDTKLTVYESGSLIIRFFRNLFK